MLRRIMFVKMPNKFGIQYNVLLKLLKPFYRISQRGDYWARAFREHVIEDLELENYTSDKEICYESSQGRLLCFCTTYVDNALYATNDTFQYATKVTENKFNFKQENIKT